MDLRSQRGKEMFRDEYNFIFTLNGENKNGTKLYWTCARKKICNARVHTVSYCDNALCLCLAVCNASVLRLVGITRIH